MADRIDARLGNAATRLAELPDEPSIDVVFLDADKTGYVRYWDQLVPRVRPGGLLLSLDFDRPSNPLMRAVYLGYLTLVGSALGWALHRDPDTYRYIPESIRRYPGAAGVSAMLSRDGFTDARVIPLLGGLMAINFARNGTPQRTLDSV